MASLPIQDQANAIWKALDKMLESDPEGYKRYIEEQMKDAKSFKPKGPKGNRGGEGSSQSVTSSTSSPLTLGLDMLLNNLGLDVSTENPLVSGTKKWKCQKDKPESEKNPLKKLDVKKLKASKAVIDLSGGDNNANNKNSLLDDSIGNSVIASIVTDKTQEDDDADGLVDIQLPSNLKEDAAKKKGKPLIEEL